MHRKRFMLLAVTLVALNTFFWLAPGGLALSRAVVDQLFGARMIRAEVVVQTPTGTQDYRIDRGVIKIVTPGTAATPGSITIQEKDKNMVTIQFSPTAAVTGGGGRTGSVSVLRRGLRVLVVAPANQPADTIQVEGVGGP